MAGYSGTPLVHKLGIKEGFVVGLVNPPKGFETQLGSLPDKVRIATRLSKRIDVLVFFADTEAILKRSFARLAEKLASNGMLWIAWPKKSSGVPTDLSFETVQRVGLQVGLVDVKICALDEVWSGLKFVYRLRDRGSR